MSDSGPQPGSLPWWSTDQLVLVVAMLALSGGLLAAPALGGSGASGTIGIVLAESTALYVGYRAVTRVAGPAVLGLLASG